MNKLFRTKKEKLLVGIFLLLLGSLLVNNMLIDPISTSLKSINVTIADLERQLIKDRAILAHRDVIQAQYRKLMPDKVSSRGEKNGHLLRDIEKAASGSVVIRNITPLPEEKNPSHVLERVEVVCKGKLEDLVKLVYDIQHGLRGSQVRKLKIRATDDPGGLLECSLEITSNAIRE